jgi:Gpi18-like mannosyltransferase
MYDVEKDFESLFQGIKKELTGYFTAKFKLYRLDLFEKTSRVVSFLFFGLAVLLVLFFSIFFIFLTIGFRLGELLDSIAAGMGLVALIYLILLLILLVNRQRIRNQIIDLFLGELMKDEDKNGEETS